MTRVSPWQIAGLSLIAFAAVAWMFLPSIRSSWPGPSDIEATTPAVAVQAEKAPTPAAPPEIARSVELPLPTASEGKPLPALENSDGMVKEALIELLGRRPVLSFLNLDAFLRGLVATVDNLGREQATSRLWPVVPTPGRFLVLERGDGTYVADGNNERYLPFVALASSVGTAQAAALYRRLYPLLQQAYEELGYPGKNFNERLVEVIDLLLATPETDQPIQVSLFAVQGPYPDTRPWVRYEFADPSLESRPAGQKILLRMGTANARVLKARMEEFRKHITTRISKP